MPLRKLLKDAGSVQIFLKQN